MSSRDNAAMSSQENCKISFKKTCWEDLKNYEFPNRKQGPR